MPLHSSQIASIDGLVEQLTGTVQPGHQTDPLPEAWRSTRAQVLHNPEQAQEFKKENMPAKKKKTKVNHKHIQK